LLFKKLHILSFWS